MARYGVWKPLDDDKHPAEMARYDLVLVHTMVGTLTGTDGHFRFGNGPGYDGTESHFGLGHDGTVYQWTDTAYRADCNGEGNHRAISIECADLGTGFPPWNTNGSDVPDFTTAQVDALVKLIGWACSTHGIPRVVVPDSLPSRRGLGWHRIGIDPWRVSGGEEWSTSRGKVCPGDRRVNTLKSVIFPRVAGQTGTPTPPEDDMPLSDSDVARVANAVANIKVGVHMGGPGATEPLAQALFRLSRSELTLGDLKKLIIAEADPAAIAAQVVALLPSGTVDQAVVEAGVRAVFADAGARTE